MPPLVQMLQHQLAGLPVWGWLCLLGMFVTETIMGKSKNPQMRALGLAAGTLLIKLARPTLGRLPGVGLVVTKLLDVWAPPAGPVCPTCNGTGVLPINPPAV